MVMHSSNRNDRFMTARALAAICSLAFVAGCTLSNTEAPPLAGPSGFGLTVLMTATPEVLPRDGVSRSIINVDARLNGDAFANGTLLLSTDAGTVSASQVTTDSKGHATFAYTAPGPNEAVNQGTIFVTPVQNGDVGNARSDTIRVAVVGPSVPVAFFSVSPTSPQGSEAVTFDASSSMLDGKACPLCSYTWNFGDGNSGTGMVVQHSYSTFGVQTVTLTVTSPAGPANSYTKAVVIAQPAAPVADFTFSPSSPAAGAAVTFRSTSTVGAGVTIARYVWDFDDGNPPVDAGSSATYVHPGFGAASTHSVTLTVTDSLGRTSVSAPRVVTIP
jgi:PKD repeat protein